MSAEAFLFARVAGYFLLTGLIGVALIMVRGHRWVFLVLMLWMVMLGFDGVLVITQQTRLWTNERDYLTTTVQYLVCFAVAVRLLRFLREKDGKEL